MITKRQVTHYDVEPTLPANYVYFVHEIDGKIYNFGLTESKTGFADGNCYEADTFMGFLRILVDNSIGLTEMGHLKMTVPDGKVGESLTGEIFSLSATDIGYITSNFDAVELVKKLGLFSLAQMLLIAGVFGDLKTEEGASSALSQMASISAYWILHKDSTGEGVIEDAKPLAQYLVDNLGYTQDQVSQMLAAFTAMLDAELN